jgi:predicted nucleic acid-binding protein
VTAYFFDSSALVKRYVPELGGEWVRAVVVPSAGNTILIAHITLVEVTSAAMRRWRDGDISLRTARAIRLLLHRHASGEYGVLRLTEAVVQRAGTLLEQHPLRAYDAVQLATAIEANERLVATEMAGLLFVSADTRLLAAAVTEGMVTENPTTLP